VERSRVTELHYITPVANLRSIMERGILSQRNAAPLNPASVADQDVQDIRDDKAVPGGLNLHQYVNLYLDARNPMMYKRLSHRDHIAVVRVHPAVLDIPGAVVADGNAASNATKFEPSPAGLAGLDEARVYAHSWTDADTWVYWEKKRQRCAEILVPDVVPPHYLLGCYTVSEEVRLNCREHAPDLDAEVQKHVYFA
jgi:hypothetical protein